MSNPVIECLKTRRSTKGYDPDRVPPRELLDQITEVGTCAPTGKGLQSPIIIEVTDKATRDKLSKLNAQVLGKADIDPFYGAPVVIVVLADKTLPYSVYDGSLVMGNMLNAAHALGLGSCWIHRAKEVFESPEGKALLKEWGVEGEYEGVGNCIVGYQTKEPAPAKPRKPDYVRHI